ncbi:MAG: hypothetical protein CM15mP74_14950 [Halieaceae bacterium]|nr:MAG: hypothetical protein CM15mP74_14950 [Halieaceae bacterium]
MSAGLFYAKLTFAGFWLLHVGRSHQLVRIDRSSTSRPQHLADSGKVISKTSDIGLLMADHGWFDASRPGH